MTDRPIIFSTPMIRALLAGSKTQTRRLASSPLSKIQSGDRLWVREGWHAEHWYDRHPAKDLPDIIAKYRQPKVWYQAGYARGGMILNFCGLDLDAQWIKGKGRPSIHMPRWASRLTLIVEAVKVERLSAISREDAIAEGLALASSHIEEFFRWPEPFHEGLWLSPPAAYRWLWEQLHGPGSWDANPEVVALTFRVVPQNIDAIDPAPSARAAAGVG